MMLAHHKSALWRNSGMGPLYAQMWGPDPGSTLSGGRFLTSPNPGTAGGGWQVRPGFSAPADLGGYVYVDNPTFRGWASDLANTAWTFLAPSSLDPVDFTFYVRAVFPVLPTGGIVQATSQDLPTEVGFVLLVQPAAVRFSWPRGNGVSVTVDQPAVWGAGVTYDIVVTRTGGATPVVKLYVGGAAPVTLPAQTLAPTDTQTTLNATYGPGGGNLGAFEVLKLVRVWKGKCATDAQVAAIIADGASFAP